MSKTKTQIIPYTLFVSLFAIAMMHFSLASSRSPVKSDLGVLSPKDEIAISNGGLDKIGGNLSAAEYVRICSDRFIVCGDGDSRSNSVATSRISTPVLSPSSPRMATISFYSAIDSCHYPAKGGCLTASGKIAKYGMVATNLYPFGTKIKIEGLGVFTVEDRISKRYNNRIDVWVGYGKEANVKAKQMGLQNKRIEIIL